MSKSYLNYWLERAWDALELVSGDTAKAEQMMLNWMDDYPQLASLL